MKILRKLLLPFSLLYALLVILRNKLYDWNIKESASFDIPLICVGNLSVGGTGKSPMIEYLIGLLKPKKIATLSRGYKRESKGFYLLKGDETARQVGDEPLQFKTKFEEVLVAVDEQRKRGIEHLLQLPKPPEVILLDDAFQHRKVKPTFSILLTTYQGLYINDFILPAGNLREPRAGAKRADIIVVTKCPLNLPNGQMEKLSRKLAYKPSQQIFFSGISYGEKVINLNRKKINLKELENFTLVTGIANPNPLLNHLNSLKLSFEHQNFPDHYNFKEKDIVELNKKPLIITTEKDFMRLKDRIPAEKLFYLPIKIQLLKDAEKFEEMIKQQC